MAYKGYNPKNGNGMNPEPSRDLQEIAKTLERDYPGYKATHKKGTKDEFSMFKGGKSFSVKRKVAIPKSTKDNSYYIKKSINENSPLNKKSCKKKY